MAESTRIGLGSCPVCASPKAHFTVSKKQLVCVTCNGCNFQGFARSDRSDELLRARLAPAVAEPAPVQPAPAAPAAIPVRETPPETTQTAAPRRSLLSWS